MRLNGVHDPHTCGLEAGASYRGRGCRTRTNIDRKNEGIGLLLVIGDRSCHRRAGIARPLRESGG